MPVYQRNKILIIDDDLVYHNVLTEVFTDFDVATAGDGRSGISIAKEFKPDLIVLDVVMDDMDGYEVCKMFRSMQETSATPIIFYSGMDSLQGRLKSYEFGGNDYICKSMSNEEVLAKAEIMITSENEHAAIKQEIQASSSVVTNLQRDSSHMHVISNFIQASQFCHDYETLSVIIFNCLSKFSCRGVIHFHRQDLMFSSTDVVSKLEGEILRFTDQYSRIHYFGFDRAIFNWPSISLLIKEAEDKQDIIAHLMDAVETSIRALDTHMRLVEQIIRIERENRDLRSRLKDSAKKSKQSLKEQLFDTGLISRIDIQDEVNLDQLLSGYGDDLDTFLINMDNNAGKVAKLISQIHAPPEQLREYFVKNKFNGTADDVLF